VGAKLTGADLTGVRLYDVCLAWATMTEADLDRIRDRLTKEQTASIKIVEAVYAQAN
jgi:uncharacterized protein YjbI with pentapeptide repeats